jgi:hypothetical protein
VNWDSTRVTVERIPVNTGGREKQVQVREKGFTAGELYLLMKCAGLEILHLWGGTAGNWNKHELDMDEYEIMVLAQKRLR